MEKRKKEPNGGNDPEKPQGETAAAVEEPGLGQIFEAYRKLEEARRIAAEARGEAARLKEAAKEAKEAAAGATAEADRLSAELLKVIAGLCPEAAPPKPMGWIDAETRPLRRFLLADSKDRLEFRGILDGKVQMCWYEGLLAGEPFFPRNDVTPEAWNADYASKVEGYLDPTGKAGPADHTDETWRGQALNLLDDPHVPAGVLKVLIEHDPPLTTLGELADWSKAKGDFRAKDIKGLDPVGEGELAAAVDAYWERRQSR